MVCVAFIEKKKTLLGALFVCVSSHADGSAALLKRGASFNDLPAIVRLLCYLFTLRD